MKASESSVAAPASASLPWSLALTVAACGSQRRRRRQRLRPPPQDRRQPAAVQQRRLRRAARHRASPPSPWATRTSPRSSCSASCTRRRCKAKGYTRRR